MDREGRGLGFLAAMAILQFLRLRFHNKYIIAFVGNRKTTQHAEASSVEAALRDRMPKTNSLQAAELVGFTLAERMRKKQMLRARFNMEAEIAEKAPKFHSHIKVITDTLRKNGISLLS
ncbi:uncharacterized protein LOC112341542 [Selaginella moellendorffii]|uniref:uncharacterized protein LOC112341542 n=1 Tax=Selaginella moellendorffii TaxID=88036 RepID=UPI000D1C2751|nr:uncharacterized protein LOC112341542 [Selaginella moellendorffii]|eukprot:XP_024517593.1 uncharacterized protein LOC112341542 [Selaginella moellendorffii]